MATGRGKRKEEREPKGTEGEESYQIKKHSNINPVFLSLSCKMLGLTCGHNRDCGGFGVGRKSWRGGVSRRGGFYRHKHNTKVKGGCMTQPSDIRLQ